MQPNDLQTKIDIETETKSSFLASTSCKQLSAWASFVHPLSLSLPVTLPKTLTLFTHLSRYITRENSPCDVHRKNSPGTSSFTWCQYRRERMRLFLSISISFSLAHSKISLNRASLTWTFCACTSFGSRKPDWVFSFDGDGEKVWNVAKQMKARELKRFWRLLRGCFLGDCAKYCGRWVNNTDGFMKRGR